MDGGIVGAQQQQQLHQHEQQQNRQQREQREQQQRKKEWRAVSSSSTSPSSSGDRLFQGPGGGRMSIMTRPRNSRNGRVYHDGDAPPQPTKDGDRGEEAERSSGEVHFDDPDEALHHRITEIAHQRESLQQLELELRVSFFARSEIRRLQSSFEEQAKQHSDIVANLQEQLQERDGQMQQLRQHLQDREQKLQMEANEAMKQVWAKDALLREQSNEVTNLRRERESSIAEHKAETSQLGAERADLLAQVEGLKDQVHEKERRLQEIEEQVRVLALAASLEFGNANPVQDIFFCHDKQLRDAQMWMNRAQELEVYHVNAMSVEHCERSEQVAQLCMHFQRQMTDMERYYSQIIQKLHQDIAESSFAARNKDLDEAMRGGPSDSAMHHQLKPGMVDPLQHQTMTEGLPKIEHATGLPVLPPTPIVGMPSIVPPDNNMHQYGAVHQPPVGSNLQQFPQAGPIPPLPSIVVAPSKQQPQQQVPSFHSVQVGQRPQRQQQAEKSFTNSAEQQQPAVNAQERSSPFKAEVAVETGAIFMPSHQFTQPAEIHHKPAGGNRAAFNLVIERAKPQADQEKDRKTAPDVNTRQQPIKPPPEEKQQKVASPESERSGKELSKSQDNGAQFASESTSKPLEPQLLDRDSLLACLIRAIPAEPSAKIRISSTLPNRLGKMLAPLHWHDYRKLYGRLDEFVEAHPQLFVVEGDFVYLREGAHAIVSASTAVAKATAAALMPSGGIQAPKVALTPVAQPQVQRPRSKPSETQEKSRSAPPQMVADPPVAKSSSPAYKAHPKKPPALKENGLRSGETANGFATNGVVDGYNVNFNRPGGYFKNRNQDLGARSQTQEGRILEAA